MSEKLSVKQKKKKVALVKRQTRARVSKYRENKKNDDSKVLHFYVDSSDKDILDEYKAFKGQTTSEVFKELIRSILNRRLKDLVV